LQQSKKVNHDDIYDHFANAIEKKAAPEVVDPKNFDKQFYQLKGTDTKCLSMYQPWASLVMLGIKRFEGRAWDENYRGPLWIQAGARPVDEKEVKAVEEEYRKLYAGIPNMPKFPDRYPTMSLLGVIDLQDVTTQEIYREHIPKNYTKESNSEY